MKFKKPLVAIAAAAMLTTVTAPAASAWAPAGPPLIGFDRHGKWTKQFGNQTTQWYLDTNQSMKIGSYWAWQG